VSTLEKIAVGFVVIVAGVVGASHLDRATGDPIIVGALVVAFAALAISERVGSRSRSAPK
jgi:hypothetical protein